MNEIKHLRAKTHPVLIGDKFLHHYGLLSCFSEPLQAILTIYLISNNCKILIHHH